MSSDVQCMALGTVPTGEQRSRFLAIGLSDNTVRVISLDPQDCLQPLSMQALPATPESLCIVEMAMGGLESESGRLGGLFLNIGLSVSWAVLFNTSNNVQVVSNQLPLIGCLHQEFHSTTYNSVEKMDVEKENVFRKL